MRKIDKRSFNEWLKTPGKFKYQKLGESFLEKFLPFWSDDDLKNERNFDKAYQIIVDSYVE